MHGALARVVVTAMALGGGAGLLAQDFTVRINVPSANVRSAPTTASDVVTQVASGTILTLIRIEGDWYRVALPPNPSLGGVRVEAYVSNTVAVVEGAALVEPVANSAEAEPAAAEPPVRPLDPPPPPVEPETSLRDGMSVALQIGLNTAWVIPDETSVRTISSEILTMGDLVGLLADRPLGPDESDVSLTYVWMVAGTTARQIISDRRPSLVAMFKAIPGVRPEDVVPHLVRLTPLGSSARAVAAVRARSDRASDTELNWNIMPSLMQDAVPVSRTTIERGAVRLQPASDLAPGEYGVVLRPRDDWQLAGASLLSADREGRLFSWMWGFSIPE